MNDQSLQETMDVIKDDIHHIRDHMNDHDVLIKTYTILQNVNAKIDNIEKSMALKADAKDVDSFQKQLDEHAQELKELRSYMNKAGGVALAFNTFMVIIFGLLSFIKR